MKKAVCVAAALAAAFSPPARAQESTADVCRDIPAAFRARCVLGVQAAHAGQPQMGILIAGGNPALGVAGGAGDGPRPRFGLALRTGLASVTIPDVTVEDNSPTPAPVLAQVSTPAVVLSLDGSVRVGPVELLASGTYLPFDLVTRRVFNPSSGQFGGALGARVSVLRESGALPGLALSAMVRRTGDIHLGDLCERDEVPDPASTSTPPSTFCPTTGDAVEARVGVGSLSTRAALTRHLGGVGVTLGAGYDRFSGDFQVAVLGEQSNPRNRFRVYRSHPGEVENDRWSGFLNLSRAVSVGVVVAELGWMQGGERVAGFPQESAFDPGAGRIFGSVGGRLAF